MRTQTPIPVHETTFTSYRDIDDDMKQELVRDVGIKAEELIPGLQPF